MAAPTGLSAAAACPAYPWPHDGAQRGRKVFMQSDCAACHSMLPYVSLREAARGEVEAKAAEIIVISEEAQPAAAATGSPLHVGAYSPDLTLVTKIQERLRCNLYSTGGGAMLADGAALCQELKKRMVLPSPVWLQFAQSYMNMRTTYQAA